MKKIVLLLVAGLFFSCSKEKEENKPDLSVGRLKLAYRKNVDNFIKSIATHNGEAYLLKESIVQKVDAKGNVSKLTDTKTVLNSTGSNLIVQPDGSIYYVGGVLSEHKIYKYDLATGQTTEKEVAKIFSYFGGQDGIVALTPFGKQFIFFDYYVKGLRFYFQESDLVLGITSLGNGIAQIKDGKDDEAGFKYVTVMQTIGEKIYLVDDLKNLRVVEKEGISFKVTTLISNYPNNITSLTADKNGQLFAIAENEGILKFNTSTNVFEKYFADDQPIHYEGNENYAASINFSWFDIIHISGEDMYLATRDNIIKIANYEVEIAKYLSEKKTP